VTYVTGFKNMKLAPLRVLLFTVIAASLLVAGVGCSSRASSAQKLFEQGEYQKVIDRYPDLEVARRAHAKIAEQLLKNRDYAAILKTYWDTPSAYLAKMQMAQELFDRGRYRALLDSFPQSPLAPQAKEKLADSLFALGQMDNILGMYPETERAKQIKVERGTEALAKAKKLRGTNRQSAMEEIVRTYAGTEPAKIAGEELTKLREAAAKKGKK
jgi:hypothetical protein